MYSELSTRCLESGAWLDHHSRVNVQYEQETHLTAAINLGAQAGVLAQAVLGAHGEGGGPAHRGAAGHPGLQVGRVLQIQTATEHLQSLRVRIQAALD